MKRVQAEPLHRELHEELLRLLGEELKNPLVSIAHLSEIGGRDQQIRIQVQRALNTIDNVLLYKRIANGQTELTIKPVHVGHAITEVAETMKPQMEMSGSRVELAIQSSLQPADIDQKLFVSALLSLWQAFVTNMQTSGNIVCSARANKQGIRLALLSDSVEMNDFSLTLANISSIQPLSGVAGTAMDLLAAHGMFQLAGSRITKSKRKGLSGLGVTLRPSYQMQLV